MDGSKTLYPPQLVARGIKTVSWKFIPDLEDSFLRQMFMISINHPFASRDVCIHFGKKAWSHLRGFYLYKVFTRHLNIECFESAVPAIFLAFAPTFFCQKYQQLVFFVNL